VFAAIGGIITVVVLKLLENEGTAAQRGIREEDDLAKLTSSHKNMTRGCAERRWVCFSYIYWQETRKNYFY